MSNYVILEIVPYFSITAYLILGILDKFVRTVKYIYERIRYVERFKTAKIEIKTLVNKILFRLKITAL